MKATVKARYELEKQAAGATFTLSGAPAGADLRLKASMTDATFVKGPSLQGLALSLEKPGSFIIDYNVPKQDVRFQFMNSVKLMEKPVSLTYTHFWKDNRTAVDAAVTFDPANKVSVAYGLGTSNCKVKYVYAHGELRRTVLEPCYDVYKNEWDFAVTKKFDGGDSIKATYRTSSKDLGIEWNRETKVNGSFKVAASFNLAEQQKLPKLMAESTWNYEI